MYQMTQSSLMSKRKGNVIGSSVTLDINDKNHKLNLVPEEEDYDRLVMNTNSNFNSKR